MADGQKNQETEFLSLLDSIAAIPGTDDLTWTDRDNLRDIFKHLTRKLIGKASSRTPAVLQKLEALAVGRSVHGDVRVMAIETLGSIGAADENAADRSLSVAEHILNTEQDDDLRAAATDMAVAIGDLAPEKISPALIGLFADDVKNAGRDEDRASASRVALESLGERDPALAEIAIQSLLAAVQSKDVGSGFRKNAVKSLGVISTAHPGLDTTDIFKTLMPLLQDEEDLSLQSAAIDALADLGESSPASAVLVIPAMAVIFDKGEDYEFVQKDIMAALGRIGAARPENAALALQTIEQGLKNAACFSHITAMESAGLIGTKNPEVAATAAEILLQAAGDVNERSYTREYAIEQLATVGAASPEAAKIIVRELTPLVGDQDTDLRDAAIGSLAAIGNAWPSQWQNSLKQVFRQAARAGNMDDALLANTEKTIDDASSAPPPARTEDHCDNIMKKAKKLGLG